MSSEESVASLPLPRVEAHAGWAVGLGLASGAVGGAAMMLVAAQMARSLVPEAPDVLGTIGGSSRALGGDPVVVAIALGVGIGAVVGLCMALLMRHTMRMVARVLAGVLLASTLWTLVHAFVFTSYMPALGALPFGPMVAGAATFGLFVGLLRPPRRRDPALARADV